MRLFGWRVGVWGGAGWSLGGCLVAATGVLAGGLMSAGCNYAKVADEFGGGADDDAAATGETDVDVADPREGLIGEVACERPAPPDCERALDDDEAAARDALLGEWVATRRLARNECAQIASVIDEGDATNPCVARGLVGLAALTEVTAPLTVEAVGASCVRVFVGDDVGDFADVGGVVAAMSGEVARGCDVVAMGGVDAGAEAGGEAGAVRRVEVYRDGAGGLSGIVTTSYAAPEGYVVQVVVRVTGFR